VNCRHCGSSITLSLVDLGNAPPSNAYLTDGMLRVPERRYPLRVLVCERCWLAQTEDFAKAHELFDADYAYFSSFSSSWLAHAEQYVTDMVSRLGLQHDSHVVEIGANDGYLLQYFQTRNVPCTGIEPTASTAAAARTKGIPIVEGFFGSSLARELANQAKEADLMVANNVLAHVPDINDFVSGFRALLKPEGVATFEFPHLLALVRETLFDTIYHEHFSYLSLITVDRIFTDRGLTIFDVEALSTHGGSLRVFAQRSDTGRRRPSGKVTELLARETDAGMTTSEFYAGFQPRADQIRDEFRAFLTDVKRRGRTVAGYGAAAKGNTLLNYAGVGTDLIPFVVDRNPAKVGRYTPGGSIPIVDESALRSAKPDYIVILPWNLKEEVMMQLAYVLDWKGQFVTALPRLDIAQ
jgi:SAM-dependent methyltransferase